MSAENQRLKSQCLDLSEERESLSKQVQSLMSKINVESQEKADLETRLSELQSKLEETVKVSTIFVIAITYSLKRNHFYKVTHCVSLYLRRERFQEYICFSALGKNRL